MPRRRMMGTMFADLALAWRPRPIVSSFTVLVGSALLGCGEAKVPRPEATGWGHSSTPAREELYPARYPLLSPDSHRVKEAVLQKEMPGWRLQLAASGYFAASEKVASQSMRLAPDEIAEAQRFIDSHLEVFGLTRPERLERWHDGLYYISPVGDPRYGISLLHRDQRVVLAGHLWPGFAVRSTARRDAAALLRPWLGRKLRGIPRPNMPCDPVHAESDCRGETPPLNVTIGTDNVWYAVYGRATAHGLEVREVLVLPLFGESELVEPEKGEIPPAVDARTGEPLDVTAWGPGSCEERGACLLWGWFQDESHLDFNLRYDVPRVDLVMPRDRAVKP